MSATSARLLPCRRRLLLTLAVLTIIGALVAAVGYLSAAPARAATTLPDPSRSGSLTITKLAAPDDAAGLVVGSGTRQDVGSAKTIAGVTFSVSHLDGVDVTTQAGLSVAQRLENGFDPADPERSLTRDGARLGTPVVTTTGAAGVAAFSPLPLGLYLVQETATPSGVTPSDPFVVMLPFTDPDAGATWLYDAYVYPKNATVGLTKSVSDTAASGEITWTLSGDIPRPTRQGARVSGYMLADELDPRLTLIGARVSLSDGTALSANSDYVVAISAGPNKSTTVTIEFTGRGRGTLTAHDTAHVVADLVTVANTTGEIPNTAYLLDDDAQVAEFQQACPGAAGAVAPTARTATRPAVAVAASAAVTGLASCVPASAVRSNMPQTKIGAYAVEKTSPDGAALAGATFQIYDNLDDANAGTHPLSIAGASSFTSGTDGRVVISGLRYSGFADGHEVAPGDPGFRTYYLVESTAPAGYMKLVEPIRFTVDAATTAAAQKGYSLQVTNQRSTAPHPPKTGTPDPGILTGTPHPPTHQGDHDHGHGLLSALPNTGGPTARLLVVGIVLVLSGIVMLVSRRRRTADNDPVANER